MKRTDSTFSLRSMHAQLGWPRARDVTNPAGNGAAVFAALAREKIGRALARHDDGRDAKVGVLMADPHGRYTEPPIALVVEFPRSASEPTLRELHRMGWNFSHAPTLITVEPSLVRVWTCCESPNADKPIGEFVVYDVAPDDLQKNKGLDGQLSAAQALHWINLVSGAFFSDFADRFRRNGRADQMLLGNLREIRSRLGAAGLDDDDVCHDLLARIIFVQFLFDRKDSDGAAALNRGKLTRLHEEGVLSRLHHDFVSILGDYSDTYALFDWLNTRFNGDLFPGKGSTSQERALGWAKEKRVVNKQHLALLSDFIGGSIDLHSGQACLWPQYAFDVIPLEFISSIYETFVASKAASEGIFYTPPHLVDFVLDRVLPWDGTEWDLSVLDPACGSGIFLVKAFQRLVHRWKQANAGRTMRADALRGLLERNIFGVDKDSHAVRVACFSLYLAMCDEIEPRHYWTQVRFPEMRGERLVCSDFFAEGESGFDTEADGETYDLVIGNAPWGDGLATAASKNWAEDKGRSWSVTNKDIGGLFLAKAASLLAADGRIAMIQSANSLLFNGSPTARRFRQQIFCGITFEEIYNLSALRHRVFKSKNHTEKGSVSPACLVVASADRPPVDHKIRYVSPKRLKPLVDDYTIVIEPQDYVLVTQHDAVSDESVWSASMWGTPRDRALLRKLRSYPTLASHEGDENFHKRQGIILGDRKRRNTELAERKYLADPYFPTDALTTLDSRTLPVAGELWTHSRDSTDYAAFAPPQVLIKQSWQQSNGRFQARVITQTEGEGVICSRAYVSVSAPRPVVEAACLMFNSKLAVYFLFLTSGRIAAYRPEALVQQIVQVPLPLGSEGLLDAVDDYEQLDERVYDTLALTDAERALVEDMFDYTLIGFRGARSDDDCSAPVPNARAGEDELRLYCTFFMRVLQGGFGGDKAVSATIFSAKHGARLPYRLIAFQLGGAPGGVIEISTIEQSELLLEFERLDLVAQGASNVRRGIYHERVARIYDGTSGKPMIYIVKPDLARYWTRSSALNDGDAVALDLFKWQRGSKGEDTTR